MLYPPIYFRRVGQTKKDAYDQVEFSSKLYENAKVSNEKPKPAPKPRPDKGND